MESLNKEQILQELTARGSELSAFGVVQIGLFGSFVRDEGSSESDIDLLVDIKKEFKTFRNFLVLNYSLEDIFKRKVELITKQSLSPYIGPHILKTVQYASIAS